MDEKQRERFGEAVEEKKRAAKEASERSDRETAHGSAVEGDQSELTDANRPQDVEDIRAKNEGKGKKTADKWNQ